MKIGKTLVYRNPSRKLARSVSIIEPVLRNELAIQGAQDDSCDNNARVWAKYLKDRGFKVQIVEGVVRLPQPIWHAEFGRWLSEVPHVWVMVIDGGEWKIVDGAVGQFQDLEPVYVKMGTV